jgi:hypothetical protein
MTQELEDLKTKFSERIAALMQGQSNQKVCLDDRVPNSCL